MIEQSEYKLVVCFEREEVRQTLVEYAKADWENYAVSPGIAMDRMGLYLFFRRPVSPVTPPLPKAVAELTAPVVAAPAEEPSKKLPPPFWKKSRSKK